MPNISSSLHTVAEQVIINNQNIVEILSNINTLTNTSNPSVSFNLMNSSGAINTVSYPSFSYLKTEIDRLNNNINALYGLNNNGATVQVSSSNIFKKVIAVDLNLEPKDIPSITAPTTFVSKVNYLLDNMLNPELFIKIDLTGLISDDVRKIQSRRYIVQFEQNSSGALTNDGQAALNSFNSIFKGKSNINQNDFLLWQSTTPGVILPGNPIYDEQIFDLSPNQLQYEGVFSVLKIQEDSLNNLLWYYLDTLTYSDTQNNQPHTLKVGDSLIINIDNSNTIFEIQQIANSSSNPMVVLTRTDGVQPIPVGIGTLKIYSPIINDPNVLVNVGHNEYNVLFVKAINTINYLLSRNWSLGTGYYTNDLSLNSSDSYNGQSLDKYYTNVVYDYGLALKDLVVKKIPNILGAIPSAPILDANNFKVIQTNTHLTNTPDSNLIKNQSAQVNSLNSEINQLSTAIQSKNTQLKVTKFSTNADKQQFKNEIANLQAQYLSKSSLKISINNQILNSSATVPALSVLPSYSIKGFWTIPDPVVTPYTYPQQIIGFDVQYRRLSKDGTVPPVQTFTLAPTNTVSSSILSVNAASKTAFNGMSIAGSLATSPSSRSTNAASKISISGISTQIADNNTAIPSNLTLKQVSSNTAAFSPWTELKTPTKKQILDKATGLYTWSTEDMNNPEVININQLDIPIHPNETIEIRIKSISEVGYPESSIQSDWSNTISITFPDNLSTITNQNSNIISAANNDNVKNSVLTHLNNQGLNGLLSQQTTINDTTYYLSTDNILSGFKDVNGNSIDLLAYLQQLTNQITALQAQIAQAKGELVVTILRSSEQYIVQNNSVLNFTVNCEDYCDPISGPGIPTGRVYANNIYVIRDFVMQIQNGSTTNTLGLLSSRTYTNGSNTDVYNSAVPQILWVDDQDNLITSDITGVSKTQLDNQFLWSVNYDSVNQTTVTKLGDDIGNLFSSAGNNSITNVLSSTEYNVGYADASVLGFVGNNNSLKDSTKWIDTSISISSTNKLLSTIHPSIPNLENIVDANSSFVHNLKGGANNGITIPLNIYFKMNALDPSKTGQNYQYIMLNGVTQNVQHIKKVKFLLDNQADNTPFVFTLVFTMNRSNNITRKILATSPSQLVANNLSLNRAV